MMSRQELREKGGGTASRNRLHDIFIFSNETILFLSFYHVFDMPCLLSGLFADIFVILKEFSLFHLYCKCVQSLSYCMTTRLYGTVNGLLWKSTQEKSISAWLQHESRPATSPKYPEEVDVPAGRCCCSHWTSSQQRVISEEFELFKLIKCLSTQ